MSKPKKGASSRRALPVLRGGFADRNPKPKHAKAKVKAGLPAPFVEHEEAVSQARTQSYDEDLRELGFVNEDAFHEAVDMNRAAFAAALVGQRRAAAQVDRNDRVRRSLLGLLEVEEVRLFIAEKTGRFHETVHQLVELAKDPSDPAWDEKKPVAR